MPPGIQPLRIEDFSGGWNPRDAASELANNESPDCINITLDERGGVVKRLGLINLSVAATPLTNVASNLFYWVTGNVTIVQDGAAVKKTSDFVTFTTIGTWTTSARGGFVDFAGKLVAVHPVDGVFTYDGTTWAHVASSPVGTCIANWQNRVWVANGSTLRASGIGDPTTWAVGDTNDIREKDSTAITALGGGQGQDPIGRPGMLVFKQRSTYRVNDSKTGTTFGAYTTISTTAGASGPNAVAQSADGTVAFIGLNGIYATDGLSEPELVSQKIQNLFSDVELNLGQAGNWAAGVILDRFVFSLTRGAGQTTNNFTLEYNPKVGWIVPHSFGCSAYTSFTASGLRRLYGSAGSVGKVYNVFSGGSDDGTAISARYHTRWFQPGSGYEFRMRRLQVAGRGQYSIYTKGNFTEEQGILSNFISGQSGSSWGGFNWGNGTWGSAHHEDIVPFNELGVARAVAFNVTETSSLSALAPKLLQDGTAAEIGSFALYGLTLDYIRLGTA